MRFAVCQGRRQGGCVRHHHDCRGLSRPGDALCAAMPCHAALHLAQTIRHVAAALRLPRKCCSPAPPDNRCCATPAALPYPTQPLCLACSQVQSMGLHACHPATLLTWLVVQARGTNARNAHHHRSVLPRKPAWDLPKVMRVTKAPPLTHGASHRQYPTHGLFMHVITSTPCASRPSPQPTCAQRRTRGPALLLVAVQHLE